MDALHPLGAEYLGDGRTRFVVWAPKANAVAVHLVAPVDRLVPLEYEPGGYFAGIIDGVEPGARYFYRLNDRLERPDPASRYQPLDVHGPSQVIAGDFAWTDQSWRGRPIQEYVIYELHVGTITEQGTFSSLIDELDGLVELGVTAIEIMPVAQCPGNRNWGYDGVYPFAAQASYGGPEGLKSLVNACHVRGLAVLLDVVYNHLGPEGNYLADFGYYYSDRYHTPWGHALNYDGPLSDEVRRYFLDNAVHWLREFHFDGLRLDAVHAIIDQSACHFLRELGETVQALAGELGRPLYVIAESNRNDPIIVRPRAEGGHGLDGQYLDDFPRSLHALLTGERHGPYRDFSRPSDFGKAYREGFVLTGQYSHYRQRRHGAPGHDIPAERFVVFAQNHDAMGNRLDGQRLSGLIDFESLKLAAGTLLFSPYVPALFMGEEYGEPNPFYYFLSHHDQGLVQRVREGRKRELAFGAHEPPDPYAESTFAASRANLALRHEGRHALLWKFHQRALQLRREIPAIIQATRATSETLVDESRQILTSRRWYEASEILVVLNFGAEPLKFEVNTPHAARWQVLLDSAAAEWGGANEPTGETIELPGGLPLHPKSCFLLRRV